ncbi:isopentenyl pyrophosphate isomerase [Halobacteriales archaeon SW_7_68_16]|nr:MAG: isopentenyl pyrophosphate isomerase [Halobacteriales archaeon SW_7_68_16]
MEFLERRRSLVEDRLEAVIRGVDPDELADDLAHATLSGGKRVRPLVTVLACETVGGDPEDAVEFAAGIELVHTASLVIDDIIDRSPMRRGVDSSWAAAGYGPAIVASDGLLGEAFALFSSDPRATRTVADALVELGEGEASELVTTPEEIDEYIELARRKTGVLFRAAAELGAVAAEADPATVDALGEYAERVGVAFQIRDDVLDATADAADLGKPAGVDADLDRPSIVQVTDLSPDAATGRAREEADRALDALDTVAAADTEARAYLADLAEFVVVRER